MTRQEELAAFLAIENDLVALLEPLDGDRINHVPFAGSWTAGMANVMCGSSGTS